MREKEKEKREKEKGKRTTSTTDGETLPPHDLDVMCNSTRKWNVRVPGTTLSLSLSHHVRRVFFFFEMQSKRK